MALISCVFNMVQGFDMSGIPTITPLDAVVGGNVQKLRAAGEISQEKLAEIIGCSVPMLSQLENGKRAWKTKWVWAVSQYFGVEAYELFADAAEVALVRALRDRMEVYKKTKPSKRKS